MTVDGNNEPGAGAVETLRRVDDVRRHTRGLINAAWFPLLLWGSIVLISAPITLASDAVIGFYWLLAAPTGIFLTARFFRRQGFKGGFEARYWRIDFGLSVAIAVSCAALGSSGNEMISAVGPIYAVAVGVLAFGALHRSASYALASLALIVSGTLIVAADPSDPNLVAAIVEGVLMVAAGFIILFIGRSGGGEGASIARVQAG